MFTARKIRRHEVIPQKVYRDKRSKSVTESGVVIETVVKVEQGNSKIPDPKDYRLSALLESGVTLNRVSSVIDDNINESDINQLNKIVEQNLKSQEDE